MIFVRKRLFIWLLKAYIKKWGKRFIFFFLLGLLVFFAILKTGSFLVSKIPVGEKVTVGMVGDYKIENLPQNIISDISYGLTTLGSDGTVKPGLAKSWVIKDEGKEYQFTLYQNGFFNDGTKVTSAQINYNFSDAIIEKPSTTSIIFKLKDSYSPFLTTVSAPVLKKGSIGVAEYKIRNIDINGDFVQSLTLVSAKNALKIKTYRFYPSETALKLAYVMGEVSNILGIYDLRFKDSSLNSFPNTIVTKTVNYNRLVTLFFNTQDSNLSNEKIRSALSYALPNTFVEGQRHYSPLSPNLWAYTETAQEKKQDIEHAKELLSGVNSGTSSGQLHFVIKTLPKYKKTAETIRDIWEEIDVKTSIEVIDTLPSNFQIFLGDFIVPKDPDQYTLWHKNQIHNITNYSNLRIDKLLEDGRKTTDIEKRKKIYADFQKYLLADSPAAFLYFPYEYEIKRK